MFFNRKSAILWYIFRMEYYAVIKNEKTDLVNIKRGKQYYQLKYILYFLQKSTYIFLSL